MTAPLIALLLVVAIFLVPALVIGRLLTRATEGADEYRDPDMTVRKE